MLSYFSAQPKSSRNFVQASRLVERNSAWGRHWSSRLDGLLVGSQPPLQLLLLLWSRACCRLYCPICRRHSAKFHYTDRTRPDKVRGLVAETRISDKVWSGPSSGIWTIRLFISRDIINLPVAITLTLAYDGGGVFPVSLVSRQRLPTFLSTHPFHIRQNVISSLPRCLTRELHSR